MARTSSRSRANGKSNDLKLHAGNGKNGRASSLNGKSQKFVDDEKLNGRKPHTVDEDAEEVSESSSDSAIDDPVRMYLSKWATFHF